MRVTTDNVAHTVDQHHAQTAAETHADTREACFRWASKRLFERESGNAAKVCREAAAKFNPGGAHDIPGLPSVVPDTSWLRKLRKLSATEQADIAANGRAPGRAGRTYDFPRHGNKIIVECIRKIRRDRQPVCKSFVINCAKAYLEDTAQMSTWVTSDGSWNDKKFENWYYRDLLATEPELNTGNQKPLDLTRDQWAKVEYVKTYFQNICDWLVQNGVATANPEFNYDDWAADKDDTTEWCFWNAEQAGRVASSDEAKAEGETMGGQRRNARIVRCGDDDDGTTLHTKGPASFSVWAGQLANNEALPWCGVFSGELILCYTTNNNNTQTNKCNENSPWSLLLLCPPLPLCLCSFSIKYTHFFYFTLSHKGAR